MINKKWHLCVAKDLGVIPPSNTSSLGATKSRLGEKYSSTKWISFVLHGANQLRLDSIHGKKNWCLVPKVAKNT